MSDKAPCIAIIPARGGSKGLKGKNIRSLCGKPLIAWTIEAALRSKYIDKVIVSTDCREIANIATQYGAKVPFLRPKELAQDDSSSIEVVTHLVDKLGLVNEIIFFLQPTSPLRNEIHIDEAFEIFKRNKTGSLISISKLDKSPLWSYWIENGEMVKVSSKETYRTRRQDLPEAYALNGAICIFNVNFFVQHTRLFDGSTFYIMDKRSSVDIDDELDFRLAKIIMEMK